MDEHWRLERCISIFGDRQHCAAISHGLADLSGIFQAEVGGRCKLNTRDLNDEILKNLITLQTSSLPFTIGMLSSSLWLRYGTLIGDTTLIVVNSIGASLFALYSLSFFLFTVKKRKVLQQLMLVLLMISFALGYSYVADSDAEASRLIGEWDWYECLHFEMRIMIPNFISWF